MFFFAVDYFQDGQKVSFGGAGGRNNLTGIYPDPPPLHLQQPRHTRGSFHSGESRTFDPTVRRK